MKINIGLSEFVVIYMAHATFVEEDLNSFIKIYAKYLYEPNETNLDKVLDFINEYI